MYQASVQPSKVCPAILKLWRDKLWNCWAIPSGIPLLPCNCVWSLVCDPFYTPILSSPTNISSSSPSTGSLPDHVNWRGPSRVDVPLLAIHRVVPATARHGGIARWRHVELTEDAKGVLVTWWLVGVQMVTLDAPVTIVGPE